LKNTFAQFLKQQGVISFKETQVRKGVRAEKKKKHNIETEVQTERGKEREFY
jgi:hypothetical protein